METIGPVVGGVVSLGRRMLLRVAWAEAFPEAVLV
jgi:hypothetical protein